jgi:hypothetical protein
MPIYPFEINNQEYNYYKKLVNTFYEVKNKLK